MIRIAIVNDEIIFAKKFKKAVDNLFQKQHLQFQSFIYTESSIFSNEYRKDKFQLIFLDLNMPDVSGMEIASKIRASESEAALIFVSNHSSFVFETFQFSPFRFLRKEWLKNELPEAIRTYCNEIAKKSKSIKLRLEDNSIISENIGEIVYFFSVRHDIYYVTPYETKMLYAREYTLEKLEEQLLDRGFLRIHKTYLLNYKYVYHIGADTVELTLKDEDKLPISHRRVPEIRKQFHVLMRGGDDA